MARPTTRGDILAAATRRFAVTGFKGTSLRDIASEVGCSKAALLYHFTNKQALITELAAPTVNAFEALNRQLTPLHGRAAQAAAIDGYVDLALRFRQEIALLHGELPELSQQPAFAPVRRLTRRLHDALAARTPNVADRIAAMIILAGIPAACVEFADLDNDTLRPILRGIAQRALPADRPGSPDSLDEVTQARRRE